MQIRFKYIFLLAGFSLLLQASQAFAQYNAFDDPGAVTSGAIAGPDLSPVKEEVDGGGIVVGSTANVIVLFTNEGTAVVNVGHVNLYPSSNIKAEIALNQCAKEPLPPGAECAFSIAVTGLQQGAWSVEMLIDHDGRTRLATAKLKGNIEASGEEKSVSTDIETFPTEIDFETSNGTMPLVRTVSVKNKTSKNIKINQVRINAPQQAGFYHKTECKDLGPGEGCIISVTWSPFTKGPALGSLVIEHSGAANVVQVDIKGDFQPETVSNATIYPDTVPDKGLLVSDKEQIDFGSDISGVSAITASLVNVGNTKLVLNRIHLSGSDGGVSISRGGCREGLVLSPIEACPLTINWIPSREGSIIDDIQIHHTGARGILVLPVRGDASKAVSRDTLVINNNAEEYGESSNVGVTPVLDGYILTSHSPKRVVISGPVGSQMVRDGQKIVLAGVKWQAHIVTDGIELTSNNDEILLVFDRSLTPNRFGAAASSGSSSSSSDTEN